MNNKENIFVKLNEISAHDIEEFIRDEISPFLSIPLEHKFKESNLTNYVCKIIHKANGWVILSDGKVIGLLAGYIDNRIEKDKVYITMYGIARKNRKKGLGKELMNRFLKDVPCDCEVYTNVDEENTVSRCIYKKFGFVETENLDGRIIIRKKPTIQDKLIFNVQSDVYNEIDTYRKKVYIWGCGSVANGVKNALESRNIGFDGFFVNTDSYHLDARLKDEKIYSLDDLLAKNEAFSVIMGHSKYQLADSLNQYELIENIWLLPAITRKNLVLNQDFIYDNLSMLSNTYYELEDQLSKDNMIDYLNAHLLQDERIIIKNFKNESNYFENDIITLNNHENYLDVGAFNGDSVELFIKSTNNHFNEILAIEVINEEFEKLKAKYSQSENIRLINIGVSDHIGEDYFSFDEQSTCLSHSNTGAKVRVTTLDKLSADNNFKPTLVKMCIGDSILPILQGASDILNQFTPKLVITAGIDKYALITYTNEIKKIAGDDKYKFYLRFTDAMTECLILIAVPR